jgi:hypothetical protein
MHHGTILFLARFLLSILFLACNRELYTVTKGTQKEALLWKIAVLRMEKNPVGVGTFCPSLMLVFNIPPCWKCFPASRNVKLQHGQVTIFSSPMLLFYIPPGRKCQGSG